MISSDNKFSCCAILKKKDRETFDFLYAEFNSQFYGIALQCLGDKDLADNIMILTFTNIWRDLEKFNGDTHQLKSFCTSILMRSLRSHFPPASSAENEEIKNEKQLKTISI